MMKPQRAPSAIVRSLRFSGMGMFSRRCFWSTCITTFITSTAETKMRALPMDQYSTLLTLSP